MPKTYNLAAAKRAAAKIGVVVRPSTRKNKKLDVFSKEGKLLASIGDIRYEDFTVHKDPERRRRYKQRFERSRHVRGSASYYADKILW